MKKFFEDFKAFAMRGNVIDMAVGVIIGAAFGSITTSLVNETYLTLARSEGFQPQDRKALMALSAHAIGGALQPVAQAEQLDWAQVGVEFDDQVEEVVLRRATHRGRLVHRRHGHDVGQGLDRFTQQRSSVTEVRAQRQKGPSAHPVRLSGPGRG